MPGLPRKFTRSRWVPHIGLLVGRLKVEQVGVMSCVRSQPRNRGVGHPREHSGHVHVLWLTAEIPAIHLAHPLGVCEDTAYQASAGHYRERVVIDVSVGIVEKVSQTGRLVEGGDSL